MAITTENEKLAVMGVKMPVVASGAGIEVESRWQLLGFYPRAAAAVVPGTFVPGGWPWIIFRRR